MEIISISISIQKLDSLNQICITYLSLSVRARVWLI